MDIGTTQRCDDGVRRHFCIWARCIVAAGGAFDVLLDLSHRGEVKDKRLGKLDHEHRVQSIAKLDRAQRVSLPAVVDLPDLAATSPYSALMNRVCSGADAEAWTHGLKALRDEQQALAEALQRAIAKQRRAWDGTDVSATVDEIETIVAEIDRLTELLGSQGVGDHEARGDAAEESRQAAAKLARAAPMQWSMV